MLLVHLLMLLTEEQRYHSFATTVDACRRDQAQILDVFGVLSPLQFFKTICRKGFCLQLPSPSPGRSESQPGGYVSVRAQELELGTMS